MNKTLFGFFKKEFLQALRDPRMKFLLFIAPVIQLVIFGFALKTEVKNIDLLVRVSPNDTLLKNISREAYASGWFIPAKIESDSLNDVHSEIKKGNAEVVLIAPPEGLSKSVEREEGQLQVLIDSSDLLRARTIESYIKTIVNKETQLYLGYDYSLPLRFETRILYNPSMNTSYFMVPGVLCMLICIITIILTSMSLAKEKEIGTFETLISAPVSITEILLGKTFPFFVIGSINIPFIIAFAIFVFGVPMRGSYIVLTVASLFFVITTVSLGTLISTISKNQQQAMMGSFLFLFPAIYLSGVIFPVDNMPKFIAWIAYLNPLMYFVTLIRNIMLKGGDPVIMLQNMSILILIAGIFAFGAFRRFRMTLG